MNACWIVDPGHGGRDPGATFHGLNEKDVVLDVALRLEKLMRGSRVEIQLTRRADVYLGLRDRVKFCKELDGTHFLSLHLNADPDPDEPGMPEADGNEAFYMGHPELAQAFCDGILKEFPDEHFRGIKQRALYVIRKTPCPATLLEMDFIDHLTTSHTLTSPATLDRLAAACQRGIYSIT